MLDSQVRQLQKQLDRARKAIASDRIDAALQARVKVRFDALLHEQGRRLDAVARAVAARGGERRECWEDLARVQRDCEPLFRECLAFVDGALTRAAGLDDGLCPVADALLDDLSRRADVPWGRFTLLAGQEFYGELAGIIRLRFPEHGAWNLPVAAHEFGHFVGPEIKSPAGATPYPFQAMLERRQREGGTRDWSHLHEHFADAFAAFALGPAYACTCLLLRFNPATAAIEQEKHPSAARRAYLILKTVERVDYDLLGMVRQVGERWQANLRSAGQSPDLSAEATGELEALLEELYPLLDERLPGVRYDGWANALRLEQQCDLDADPETAAAAALATVPGARIADALNAAWLGRIERAEADADAVGRWAVALCRQLA